METAVLLASATADALGVPFEGMPPDASRKLHMLGGYGGYRAGEWSDHPQMALCIAHVVADGVAISSDARLDLIARNFLS